MSLSLIVGPPNSGKAGQILAGLRKASDRDPTLVVPTLDDANRFERELCEAAGETGVLGVSIQTFQRLFEDVARATGVRSAPALTEAQRLWVTRSAARRTKLRILARSAQRAGFAPALAALIDEAQASGLGPGSLAASAEAAEPTGGYLRELGALYAAYADARDALGYGDEHVTAAQATNALRAHPEAWGRRPVFIYGFDDMTVEQLDLVSALAAIAEVTVSVVYEDRAALTARARLYQELRERGGEVDATELGTPRSYTQSAILVHLERSFLRDGAEPAPADDGLALMQSAGERGQAEQIGGEIARLLAAGVAPDEIAVVVRSPTRYGPQYEGVLASFGVPVAVEAGVPLGTTATGRALLALLRAASPRGRADDVLAFVRTPGVAGQGDADWLERAVRRGRLRTADEAIEAWRGRELFELEQLRRDGNAAPMLSTLARFARRIAERPHEREAPLARGRQRLELGAGDLAAEALSELTALGAIADPADAALCALEAIEVPLWRGPTDGHVRVTSPYRVRASRVAYLFVASLQEGEFPRHDSGEPFLTDEQRTALGLSGRAVPEDEERYLFHACLSRPTRRLYLCWRETDDEGAESPRSPFVDDVIELVAGSEAANGSPAGGLVLERRTLDQVTFTPDRAPSVDELARSLAVSATPAAPVLLADELGLADEVATELGDRLARARRRLERRRPGPLEVPQVVAELRGRELFGASTLEEYALCSYRWFVQHELRPQTTDPEPEALAQGSAIHAVLEELYRNPPAGGAAPRPATLEAWRDRAAELVAEQAGGRGLGGEDAGAVASRARMVALIDRFLEREAALDSGLQPDPELLEASFGAQDDADRPALAMDGFGLHGKIDRVDVPAPGAASGLIRDYKVSRKVTTGATLAKEGKLQPQLYALALERLWGRKALGGVYQPLAATDDHRLRGIALREEADGLLAGLELVGPDLLAAEDFREALNEAEAQAGEIVAAMRSGRIDRDPIDDSCPPFCNFQAICRRERLAPPEPEPTEEDEQDSR